MNQSLLFKVRPVHDCSNCVKLVWHGSSLLCEDKTPESEPFRMVGPAVRYKQGCPRWEVEVEGD